MNKTVSLLSGVCLLISAMAAAREGRVIDLSEADFVVGGPGGEAKLARALADVPGVLKNFRPRGAKISGLAVTTDNPDRPRIRFKVTIPIWPQGAKVVGDASIEPRPCSGGQPGQGYHLVLDLKTSDEPVAANASAITVDLCARSRPDGSVAVHARSAMVEGYDYGIVAGPTTRKLLTAQTQPLIDAITLRIASQEAAAPPDLPAHSRGKVSPVK